MFDANRRTVVRSVCLTILMIAPVALSGCPGIQQVVPTGTVKIQITDGPFPFDLIDSATVTITRIEVLPALAAASQPAASSQPADDGEDVESTLDDEGTDQEVTDGQMEEQDDLSASARYGNGNVGAASTQPSSYDPNWVVVFEGEEQFDLLDLRNGRADLLADTEIPADTYVQMRLVVSEGTVTLKDGRTFSLRIPSGAQSGIRPALYLYRRGGPGKAAAVGCRP